MAELKKTKQGYKLVWQDILIFPDLESDDKISVTRGQYEKKKYFVSTLYRNDSDFL